MQAAVGDRLHVRASIVGQPERTGEIVEVRGAGGEPPCLVRFDGGHTALVFPARTRSSSVRAGPAGKDRPKASPPVPHHGAASRDAPGHNCVCIAGIETA